MKRYKVEVLPSAKNDVKEILRYLRGISKQVAKQHNESLFDGFRSLTTFPLRCPPVRNGEYAQKGYRYLVVKYYLILFTVEDNIVTIRRVVDGRSNYLPL